MKKYFFYILLFITQFSYSQKIIFTNPFGGQNSNGGISSYDFASGKVTTPISLPGNPLGLVDGWRMYDPNGYYNGDDAGRLGLDSMTTIVRKMDYTRQVMDMYTELINLQLVSTAIWWVVLFYIDLSQIMLK
jgi:hypothetical protein